MTTFGFPPFDSIFASKSPNVLDTDNRPGNTLYGPIIISFFSSALFGFPGNVVAVLYKKF